MNSTKSMGASCARATLCIVASIVTATITTAAEPRVEEAWVKTISPRTATGDLGSKPPVAASEMPRLPGAPSVASREHEGFHTAGPGDPLLAGQPKGFTVGSSDRGFSNPDMTVEGAPFSGAFPADPTGDIGGGLYVQLVSGVPSTLVTILDASDGSIVVGPTTLSSLWPGDGACAEGWGQPMVAYDERAERWVLGERGAGNHLCLYVSQTADPVAGGYWAYDLAAPEFPDDPRLAVWLDAYVVTTNESEPTVYAIERDAVLAGTGAVVQRFTAVPLSGFGDQSLVAADIDGANPPAAGTAALLARQVDGTVHGGSDRIEIFELHVDWANPQYSALAGPMAIAASPFDSSLCGLGPDACVPQPGTDQRLDPVREEIGGGMHYRNLGTTEIAAGAFAVDADGADTAGVRWFVLRRSAGAWSLYQEGTFAPDGTHRWLGSVAVDRQGNLALLYTASDAGSTFPSLRYAGRLAAEPAGIMSTGDVELRTGDAAQQAGPIADRWGRGTSLTVNPADGCTFFATGQYATGGAWATAVGAFAFDACRGPVSDLIFADGFESGDTSAW